MRLTLMATVAVWMACTPAPPPGDADPAALQRALAEVEGLLCEPREFREGIRMRGDEEVLASLVATFDSGAGWAQNEYVSCTRPLAGKLWKCSSPYVTTSAYLPSRGRQRGASAAVTNLSGPEAAALLHWLDGMATDRGDFALTQDDLATVDCVGERGPGKLWARCCPIVNHGDVSFGIVRVGRSNDGFELESVQRPSWAEDPSSVFQLECEAATGPGLLVD